MPSQAFDTGWDFGPVLGLIDSDLHVASPTHSPASQAAVPIQLENRDKDAEGEGGLQLGNFGKLFQELGLAKDVSPPPDSPVDPGLDELSSPDDAELVPRLAADEAAKAAGGDAESGCPERDDTDPVDNASDDADISNRQARKAARKAAKKERKAKEKLEKQEKPEKREKPKELSPVKREDARKTLEVLVDATPDTPTPRNGPAPSQSRYPLRSNVGAKIIPATPVQVDRPASPQKRVPSPSKQKTPKAKPNQSPVRRPALVQHRRLSSLAQPFTPAPAATEIAVLQPAPVLGLDPSQFPTYHTPTPLSYAPPQVQFCPTGYFTQPFTGPAGNNNGLVPRTVQPVMQPRSTQPVVVAQPTRHPATPGRAPRSIIIRPQLDRHVHFLGQLLNDFPDERKWLVSPMQLCNEKLSAEGIHIFVDASNIMIGFNDLLRRSGIHPYDLSFDSLALLMERRRPVAKRVSASSHREAAPLPHVTKLVDTSKAVGYENNVKEQVYIRREESEKKKFFKDVEKMGWHKATQRRSGNGSGSDSEMNAAVPATPSAPKWVEQGVDEILHLKMCQSIIDAEVPTTIVLATGDGAEAEHSDGFLAHVERALKKGWKVELLSWRQQLNGGYKNTKFRKKWDGQFRVIELDDYLECLMDTP
jgi:hypothetical protein